MACPSPQSEKSAKHPPWLGPHGSSELRVHNSLTSSTVPFLTSKDKEGKSKYVGWYTCGPTVYDSAHLGHARCYVTFDIIRRILADYFKYNVFYVMNITDVDDKVSEQKESRVRTPCNKEIGTQGIAKTMNT
jgi:cysteinyl-tRNA synthetase